MSFEMRCLTRVETERGKKQKGEAEESETAIPQAHAHACTPR